MIMTTDIRIIREIYDKRITLFRDLLECVTLERDNLINLDIKTLWALMLKKQKIIEDIETESARLRDLTGDKNHYHDLPTEDRQQFVELSQKLADLKENIRARVTENVSFIKDSLEFFHEIISVFTSSVDTEEPYGPGKKKMKNGPSRIYKNEV